MSGEALVPAASSARIAAESIYTAAAPCHEYKCGNRSIWGEHSSRLRFALLLEPGLCQQGASNCRGSRSGFISGYNDRRSADEADRDTLAVGPSRKAGG